MRNLEQAKEFEIGWEMEKGDGDLEDVVERGRQRGDNSMGMTKEEID